MEPIDQHPSGLAIDPDGQGLRQSHHLNHTHPIFHNHNSPAMLTHIILSIYFGPYLDHHLACGLVAMLGSEMEGGGLVLRGGGWGIGDLLWER